LEIAPEDIFALRRRELSRKDFSHASLQRPIGRKEHALVPERANALTNRVVIGPCSRSCPKQN
jgi:hypothetical protein